MPRYFVLTWLVALLPTVHSDAGSPDLLERLTKEGPKAWADYWKRIAEFNQHEFLIHSRNSDGRIFHARTTLKRNRERDKFLAEQFIDSDRLGKDLSLWLLRRDYACELTKKLGSDVWLVTALYLDVEKKPKEYWDRLGLGGTWGMWELNVPTIHILPGNYKTIGELIAEYGLLVETCEPSARDRSKVNLVLKSSRSELLPGKEARELGHRLRRMVLELDPQRHWIVLRGETLEDTVETTVQGSFFLDTREIGGITLPSKYERQYTRLTKATKTKEVHYELREYKFVRDSPPDEEFELTYYGIPAAIAARPAGGPKTWQWLALAGAVLLAVGVGIYWWLGRRQAAPSR